jgi:RNA polymerase sigma-70 factor (ECF subfamily)
VDDDTLMRRAVSGDEAAFGQIVRAHQRCLIRFAERMLAGDAHTAHDVVQEAFLRVWGARAAYRPDGCLRSFLFRIVRNVCLDYARRARPAAPLDAAMEQTLPIGDTMESAYQSRALAQAVRDAVQKLPEPQRIVFLLSQYEQLEYRQIAEILECPIGTVASRKRLAVETLRRRLAAWMDADHEV